MKKILFISILICSIFATSAQGVIRGSVLVRDSVRVAPQCATVVIIYSNDSPPKELHKFVIWSEDDGVHTDLRVWIMASIDFCFRRVAVRMFGKRWFYPPKTGS